MGLCKSGMEQGVRSQVVENAAMEALRYRLA